MRVLVTGGAGFIGSHLVDALCEQGHEVRVIDNLSTGKAVNLDHCFGEIGFVNGSILEPGLVEEQVEWSQLVFHLAAAVGVRHIVDAPLESLLVNTRGTEIVLEMCFRHWRKVVLASTSEVYGKTTKVPMQEDDGRVLGPTTVQRWSYSTAKAFDEHLAFAYAAQGLPAVVVRYFNSYGPRLDERGYGSVVANFIRQSFAGEPRARRREPDPLLHLHRRYGLRHHRRRYHARGRRARVQPREHPRDEHRRAGREDPRRSRLGFRGRAHALRELLRPRL